MTVTPAPGRVETWHTTSAQAACERLDVEPSTGLTSAEVVERRTRFGPNALAAERAEPGWRAFLRRYRDLMQLVLVGAALVSVIALGDVTTGVVVFLLTVLNALMGLHQEGKAAESVAALRQMLVMTARVRRDGQQFQVPAEELAPGDIVGFEAGDKVPADGRIPVAASLEIEEAGLTGESTPVPKGVESVTAEDAPLGDRVDMAYMNSRVTRGRGEMVVTATGMATEVGRISDMLSGVRQDKTPLTRQLDRITIIITVMAAVALVAIVVLGLARGEDFDSLFVVGISLAIAAIPTGLPAVVTMLLSLGTRQLADRGAIVKRLKSVETLGSTSAICSDKTGTLTLNQMTARQLVLAGRRFSVDGEGYSTTGRILAAVGDERVPLEPVALPMALASDAVVRDGGCIGDPTEGAGARRPVTRVLAGFMLLVVGMAALLPVVPRATSGWWLALPLAVAGCGLGLLVSQLNAFTLSPRARGAGERGGRGQLGGGLVRSGLRPRRRGRCHAGLARRGVHRPCRGQPSAPAGRQAADRVRPGGGRRDHERRPARGAAGRQTARHPGGGPAHQRRSQGPGAAGSAARPARRGARGDRRRRGDAAAAGPGRGGIASAADAGLRVALGLRGADEGSRGGHIRTVRSGEPYPPDAEAPSGMNPGALDVFRVGSSPHSSRRGMGCKGILTGLGSTPSLSADSWHGGPELPGITVWDVVTDPDETFFFDVPVAYARHYGMNVTYSQSSGFYLGSPLFVAAGLGVNAMANARSRSRAEMMAREQWREHQLCRLLVSDRRFLCRTAAGWLSFYYGGITALYPDLPNWALLCEFSDAEPLLLAGHAGPLAAVVAIERVWGAQALSRHPGLAMLGPVDRTPRMIEGF